MTQTLKLTLCHSAQLCNRAGPSEASPQHQPLRCLMVIQIWSKCSNFRQWCLSHQTRFYVDFLSARWGWKQPILEEEGIDTLCQPKEASENKYSSRMHECIFKQKLWHISHESIMTLSACILLSSPCHIWTVIQKNHQEFPQHSNQAQRGHTCNSAYLEPFDHLNENDHLFKVAKLMALVFIWSTDHAELWVTPQISLKQQERCLAGPWEPELNLTCLPPLEAWLDPRYLTMKLSPVKVCDNHHTQETEC